MSLTADLTVATRPNAVAFTLTVRNDGDEPVDLTFSDGQTADVVVREADGEDGPETVVWRWSEGRMFTQAIRTMSLAPGESLAEEFTWEQPRSGEFRAEATLEAMDTDVRAGGRFGLN